MFQFSGVRSEKFILRCMHYIGEIRDLEVELIDAATAHL